MFAKNKPPPIKSLIAQGSAIVGNMSFSDGLRIDGEISGDVVARSEEGSILVISETARVSGKVVADHVVVNGTVQGPVHALQLLELQPKARIEGDVHYKAIEMHQGAIISGQLRPMLAGEEKTPLTLAASNA